MAASATNSLRSSVEIASSIVVFVLAVVPPTASQEGGAELAAFASRAIAWRSRMISPPARLLAAPQAEEGAEISCKNVMAPTHGSTSGKTVLTIVPELKTTFVQVPLFKNWEWF